MVSNAFLSVSIGVCADYTNTHTLKHTHTHTHTQGGIGADAGLYWTLSLSTEMHFLSFLLTNVIALLFFQK